MNRPSPGGLVHSIQARLKNEAHERGRPFAELLELFAVERFLHRLGRSEHRERFVLKGALLLRHWLGAHTRPTRDIDLLGAADLDAERLRSILRELLRVDVEEDGIEFQLDSIIAHPIRVGSPVLGLRAKFDAQLGLGEANSRLKDYYDLVLLPRTLAFDGPTLVESIRRTFARRATAIPSEPLDGLSDAFAQNPINTGRWRAFLEKGGLTAVSPDLGETVEDVRSFAQPAVDAAREGRSLVEHWPPGGPWQ